MLGLADDAVTEGEEVVEEVVVEEEVEVADVEVVRAKQEDDDAFSSLVNFIFG